MKYGLGYKLCACSSVGVGKGGRGEVRGREGGGGYFDISIQEVLSVQETVADIF